MNGTAVTNEFVKMRHLGIGLVATIMGVAIVGLSVRALADAPDVALGDPTPWNALLAGMSVGIPLVCPLLLAILASRQTDIEHQGNGWLAQSTAGVTPGTVCRAKFVALGLVVATVTIASSLTVLAIGHLLVGATPPPPLGHWFGFTACVLAVNLSVLALYVLLAARVENQLVVIGIGILGCVVAVFSQGLPPVAAHLTPWGYYALVRAAGYEGEQIVTRDLGSPSIAVFAIATATAFLVITHRFDRQEA